MAAQLHCSPRAFDTGEKTKTCFTLKELRLLASEFNKKNPERPVRGKTKGELVKALLKAYKAVCDDHQFCWIRQTLTDHAKIAELEKAFRPPKPEEWERDRNTWLTTTDILYVMRQYEELYKDFKFMGVFPIDFADNSKGYCIGDMMCDFDIHRHVMDHKMRRFGVVFNTDKSYRSGQHWISLYCCLNPKNMNYGIYFYDSVANPAPKEVKEFMERVVKQVGDERFKAYENRVQKQYDNYDCGVYSCVFLTQCLKNVAFKTICARMHTDKGVNALRDVLYRPPTPLTLST